MNTPKTFARGTSQGLCHVWPRMQINTKPLTCHGKGEMQKIQARAGMPANWSIARPICVRFVQCNIARYRDAIPMNAYCFIISNIYIMT
jgi:hypothetical protein